MQQRTDGPSGTASVTTGTSHIALADLATVGVFTALYAPYVAHAAVTRAFWLDELFTFYIVTMPDWAGMFDLIRRGPDQNPPLFYVVTRLLVGCFGESEWVFRLPAMVGYWVLCVALYFLGRRLGGSPVGLVAMATPVVTGAVFYATEARPYSLMLGCFGVGLVCYALVADAAQSPARRRSAVLGLGGALTLAAAFHYFAVLPMVCLGLAELYRTWRTGRRRWAVWAALVTPLGVLASNWMLLTEQTKLPYWREQLLWLELPYFYDWLCNTPACLALLALMAVVGWLDWRTCRTLNPVEPPAAVPGPEWSALGVLLVVVLPVGWMTLMQLTGQTLFTRRYLLPAVVGLSILIVHAIRRLTAHNARRLTLGVWATLTTLTLTATLQPWRLTPPSTEGVADLPDRNRPIIVGIQNYLPLKHYFGAQLPQVVYVFGVMTYPQPDDPTRGLRALLNNPRTPRFEDPNAFFRRHHRFYVVYRKQSVLHEADLLLTLFEQHAPKLVRATDKYFVYDFSD
ncbi:MAG: glycosyltransferase family 39 protein [Chloracidobacterium sp.]|nr:glycosyltransferase family 39 protein [Chloracidobacterium sp.]MDW8218058.1 glycosyltransferase family 39 protein [Acidobacteriota bacterium]